MDREDYYAECLADAAAECGLDIEQRHIKYMAKAVAGAVENVGMAFHQPENPLVGENKRLAADLKIEQSKVHCRECDGRGTITTPGPYHSSTSECWKCHGAGKVIP